TPSIRRSPNPNKEAAESSAPRRSTVIRLCIPERRSTRLTPPVPVPNVCKADEMILQDTLQVSLAEHKSHEEIMKFERNTVPQTACRTPAVRPRDQDDPHDDAHPEGENSAKAAEDIGV
ncbi:hypothetical protein Tco_0171990, partial [Tanacetum coccineum]